MWVGIYQILEKDQIPICHLSNKSNPNTDKPNSFEFDWIEMNICKRVKNRDQIIHNFSVNLILYHIYLQIYSSNFAQYAQNLQRMMMKMINYSFNFEKFVINETLFDQCLNKYLR